MTKETYDELVDICISTKCDSKCIHRDVCDELSKTIGWCFNDKFDSLIDIDKEIIDSIEYELEV